MPNWCNTTYAIYGNSESEIQEIKDFFDNVLQTPLECFMGYGNASKNWAGRLLLSAGIDPDNISCRGFIQYVDDIEEASLRTKLEKDVKLVLCDRLLEDIFASKATKEQEEFISEIMLRFIYKEDVEMTDILDKLFPQGEENPLELQQKINGFSSRNPDMDENEFNTLLAAMEMEGFRKGLRAGWELCEETK